MERDNKTKRGSGAGYLVVLRIMAIDFLAGGKENFAGVVDDHG
ncbi:hypothetical protein [Bartonella gliris]|nr:hypothetical protein [Bartonella gliris]